MIARILFPFVGGDLVGGSHHSALRMIAGLDPARFRPVIVLHGEGGRLADLIEAHGLDWQRLDRPAIIAPRYSRKPGDASVPGFLALGVPRMRRLLRDWRIDIVHTNDGRMHTSWALPARLAGCRLVWHHRQSPDAFGINKIAPLLADRVVAVSEFSRPRHPLRDMTGRMQVIRSPFDLPAGRPDRPACAAMLRDRIGARPDAVVVGYFGALNSRKRPLHFIRALAALRRDLPAHDIHGAIFGQPEPPGDPISDVCRDLARQLGVADHLHLMGHVSPVEPWMAGVDALLVTALDEPFGRTLIEAMHLRTPVVATDHGGNPEAIADGVTGFLVDPADPAAFVAPMRRLLTEPGLADRIADAAASGLDRYSTARHLRRIEALYDDLLAKPGVGA